MLKDIENWIVWVWQKFCGTIIDEHVGETGWEIRYISPLYQIRYLRYPQPYWLGRRMYRGFYVFREGDNLCPDGPYRTFREARKDMRTLQEALYRHRIGH